MEDHKIEGIIAVNDVLKIEEEGDLIDNRESDVDIYTAPQACDSKSELVDVKHEIDNLSQTAASHSTELCTADKDCLDGKVEICVENGFEERNTEDPISQRTLCNQPTDDEVESQISNEDQRSQTYEANAPLAANKRYKSECNERKMVQHKSKCCDDSWLWKTYSCPDCNQYFMNLQHLQIHRRIHQGWKIFECSKCSKLFVTMFSLKKHQLLRCGKNIKKDAKLTKTVMGAKKGYWCKNCGKKLPNLIFYKVHLHACKRSLPHLCNYCGKGFSSNQKASLHQNFHKVVKPLTYRSKSYAHDFTSSFSRKNSITRQGAPGHMNSDDSSKANLATVTKNSSHNRKLSLQRHKVKCQGTAENGSHSAISEGHLVHQEKLMKCKLCSQAFPKLRQLVRHQQVHVARNVKLFPCLYCDRIFNGAVHLKTHMVVHSGEKPYSCDKCGKSFAYKSCQKRHQATCSYAAMNSNQAKSKFQTKQWDEKPFACEFCDKKFVLEEHWRNHEAFHFGVLSKSSDRFNTSELSKPSEVIPHNQPGLSVSVDHQLNSYTGENHDTSGVVQCKPCGKYFSSLSRLKAHSVVHTGEKPYQCKFCGKLFSFPSCKKRHEKIHVQKKMYGIKFPKTNNKASNLHSVSSMIGINRGLSAAHLQMDQHKQSTTQLEPNEANPSLIKCTNALEDISTSSSDKGTTNPDTNGTVPTFSADIGLQPSGANISNQVYTEFTESGKQWQAKVRSLDQETGTNENSSPHRTREMKHICGVCGTDFGWASSLAAHLAYAHNDRKLGRAFSCSVCNKTFKFQGYVLAHMISHSRRMVKCDFCDMTFRQTATLKKHLLHQHAEQIGELSKLPLKTLKCLCGEEFKKRKDFLLHEKFHKKQKLLVCKYCNKVFLLSSLYKSHLLSHKRTGANKDESHHCDRCLKSQTCTKLTHTPTGLSSLKLYPCHLCNKQFSSRHNLHLHKSLRHKSHTRTKPLNSPKLCVQCGEFCTSRKNYVDHMKKHERESQLSNKSNKAEASRDSSTDTSTNKRAKSAKESLSTPVIKHVLSLLPMSPANKVELKKQTKKRLKPKVNCKPKKKKVDGMLSLWSSKEVSHQHSCIVCLKTFKSTWALQNHMTVHLRLKPTRCDFCDKIFAHVADLIEHKLQHCEVSPAQKLEEVKKAVHRRKSKLFSCERCESEFPARSHLLAHMVVHTGAKPFSCDVCGRKFSFLSCLKRHLIVHIRGDKSGKAKSQNAVTSSRKKKFTPNAGLEFSCTDCGSKFFRLDSLHDHICRHMGILPYKCPDCEAQFVNFADLKQHKKDSHSASKKSKDHICEVCGKVFQQLKHLKAHMSIHCEAKTWMCEICGSDFPSLPKLKKHQMMKCEAEPGVSPEGPRKSKLTPNDSLFSNDLELFTGVTCKLNLQNFECVDCHKVFSRYRHLRKHRQSCMQETTVSCATCGEKFTEIKALEKHIDDFHNLSNKMNAHIITAKKRMRRSRGYNPTGKKHFRCDVCGKEFVSALYLSNHSALHTGDMPVICECCGASFTHMNALQKHQTQTSCGASGGHFTCKFCDQKFESLRELRIHNSTKLGPRFTCTKCSNQFSSCYRVQRHRALCQLGKAVIPNICEVCGKHFSNASNMKEHMITHTGEKPFACGQCGRRFGHMAALRRHLSVHGGDLPFKCKVCNKGFTIASALKKHEDSHMDLKSRQVFKCEECGKGFVTRQRLKRHAYLHQDEKPLKCDFCGKGFINPFHMKNHLIQHHGMPHEEHRCKFCGLIFTSRFQLTQHQDLHCSQLAETISQLLPPDGQSDSMVLRNLRDDESIVISPMPVLEEPVIEEEYVPTQTTEIIIQENDGNGNITEKTIVVTLPENIDLAQWLQDGGEIQTETMDGEEISYITAAGSPDQLPLQEDFLTVVQGDIGDGDVKSVGEIVCQYCGEACATQEEAQAHLQQQHPFVEFVELPANITDTASVVLTQEQEAVTVSVPEDTKSCPQVTLELEEQRNHMCQHCGKQFMRGHDLNRHILSCSKSQVAAAATEDAVSVFVAAEDIQKISEDYVQSPKVSMKNFMCEECGAQYTRYADFRCHQLNTHSEVQKVEPSEICELNEVLTIDTIHNEGITSYGTQQNEPKKKSHACLVCDKVFMRKRSLQQHVLTHGETKAFKCDICDKEYAYESSLWSHMKSHDEGGKERHSCLVCGKSYIDKSYLKKHMLTHTSGTMPYICNLCSKGFLLPAGLKRHRRDVHKLAL